MKGGGQSAVNATVNELLRSIAAAQDEVAA